jgi:hypothetical protein
LDTSGDEEMKCLMLSDASISVDKASLFALVLDLDHLHDFRIMVAKGDIIDSAEFHVRIEAAS